MRAFDFETGLLFISFLDFRVWPPPFQASFHADRSGSSWRKWNRKIFVIYFYGFAALELFQCNVDGFTVVNLLIAPESWIDWCRCACIWWFFSLFFFFPLVINKILISPSIKSFNHFALKVHLFWGYQIGYYSHIRSFMRYQSKIQSAKISFIF